MIYINQKYHTTLASYFQSKPLYLDGENFKKPNVRKLVEQPWQELEAAKAYEKLFEKDAEIEEQREKLWDNVTNTLCNLNFIQAKAAAKLTYDLVNEINNALEVIPDNAEEIAKEKARQARMDKYTQDLIACAEGKISRFDLEVPESITPWTEEQINAEIERIKTNANRADKLKDFRNFMGQEADNLHYNSYKFVHFATQQAWNYANKGPVGNAAEYIQKEHHNLLLQHQSNRQQWNPLPQVLQILRGHASWVMSVSISPDGRLGISGSMDKTCIFWDLKTGKALRSLIAHTDEVKAVAITPDGRRAISGANDHKCILWDLNSGKALQTLVGHTDMVWAVDISPDGKKAISGSVDHTCIVWNLNNGKILHTLKEHTGWINAVSMTPDGRLAISGSQDETFILWDLWTGSALLKIEKHTKSIEAVSISPDGKVAISGSGDMTCLIWNFKTRKFLRLEKQITGITAVAITPDGKRALFGHYLGAQLWDVQSGQPLLKSGNHVSDIRSVAITPEGAKAFLGTGKDTCVLWNLKNSDSNLQKSFKKFNIFPIQTISIFHNGKWAIYGSQDKTCIVRNLFSGENLHVLKGHVGWVNTICISADGKRAISGSLDSTCIVWDLINGKSLQIYKGHYSSIRSVHFCPDGKNVISVSANDSYNVWDMKTGKELHRFKVFSGSGVTGSSENVQSAILTGIDDVLQVFNGHAGYVVNSLSIFPDGKLAISCLADNTCIVWNLITGSVLKILNGHTGSVYDISISSDGRRAISGSNDRTCIVWDLCTGEALQVLNGHRSKVNTVSISNDGRRAISGSADKTCIIWNIDTGKELAKFIFSSSIETIDQFSGRYYGGTTSGETFILHGGKELQNIGAGIVTVKQIWDTETECYLPVIGDCPFCGNRFSPIKSVLDSIEKITIKANLAPEDSPCLVLPDEAWEDAGLLSECPRCSELLKFNPFIAGGEDYYRDKSDLEKKDEITDEYYKDLMDDHQIYDKERNKEKATETDEDETTIKEEKKGLSTDTIVIIIAVILAIIFGYYFFK